jgi:hypothetical protein
MRYMTLKQTRWQMMCITLESIAAVVEIVGQVTL